MKSTAAADQWIGGGGGRIANRETLALASPYAEPTGALETRIAQIFAETFEIDRVGANDDFFDLGGDSLLAETLGMAISHRTAREFEVSWLLDYGTPRKVAELLANGRAAALVSADRPPIFAVHGRFGFMLPASTFFDGLAPDQKFRMFELPGIRGDAPAFRRIEDIAAHYVEQLDREYPEGPVFLAAFCTGVLIATEMAAQLDRIGRPVRRLVLIDPSVPNGIVRNYRQRAGFSEKRRPGTAGTGTWLRRQFVHAGYLLLLGRWTDGSRDADFADERLRYLREQQIRLQLRIRRMRGRHKAFSANRLSNAAQAMLSAAYRHHRPRPYAGPVSILCSAERRHHFEDETHIWAEFLPHRQVQTVVDSHLEVLKGNSQEAARAMQAIFDAARAEL